MRHTFQAVHNLLEDLFLLTQTRFKPVHLGLGLLQNVTMIPNAVICLRLGMLILEMDVT